MSSHHEELTLFHTPGACSTASWLALEEAGAQYGVCRVDLQDRGDYWDVNPHGTVPALRVDGAVIGENLAIMTYVADTWPMSALLSREPLQRARQMARLSWFSSSVHINRRRARVPVRFVADPEAQRQVSEAGRIAFWNNLKEIDDLYANKIWQYEDFGLTDCYAFVFYHWGYLDQHAMADLSHYTEFVSRIIRRPAVRRVLERDENAMLTAGL